MESTELLELHREKSVDMYRQMLTIRRFEYTVKDMFARHRIIGALHLYVGEEAVGVGAISTLGPQDYVTSTSPRTRPSDRTRSTAEKYVCETFGKQTGLCKGKGGSMHMADMNLHIFAQPIVAGGLPLALGAGLVFSLSGSNAVALSFFGDGGANQGATHESINLAVTIWKLPVVFICENNKYAEATRASYSVAGGSVARRADGYGIPGEKVDGMDVMAVYRTDKAGC